MTKTFVLLFIFALAGCGQDDKRLKEKTRKEGEALTGVENSNLASKSAAMEKDLTRRHRFYQAVKGDYEGTINTTDGSFKIRVTLSPSLAPISIERVRQLDEVTADLNNLFLNTKVSQWDPSSSLSPVSCIVSSIRPDIEKGEIAIAKEGCPNFYTLKVMDPGSAASAKTIAELVLNGDLMSVNAIQGKLQPATNATIYTFTAYKVQD